MKSLSEKKWLDIDIKAKLITNIIGKAIYTHNNVDSTNDIAKKLANEGVEEGTVVVADMQYSGKGRLDREWFSPEGGLWLSIILRPDIKPSEATKVTLMAGVAVARILGNLYNLDAKIKWPNDILIEDKKVCGILTEVRSLENQIDYIILGIGINANFDLVDLPKEIIDISTTLKHELGKDLDLEELFFALLMQFDKCYEILKGDNSNRILNSWRELSATLGRGVKITTFKETIEGTALDVDDIGALIVKTNDDKEQKFLTGDCVHVTRST